MYFCRSFLLISAVILSQNVFSSDSGEIDWKTRAGAYRQQLDTVSQKLAEVEKNTSLVIGTYESALEASKAVIVQACYYFLNETAGSSAKDRLLYANIIKLIVDEANTLFGKEETSKTNRQNFYDGIIKRIRRKVTESKELSQLRLDDASFDLKEGDDWEALLLQQE